MLKPCGGGGNGDGSGGGGGGNGDGGGSGGGNAGGGVVVPQVIPAAVEEVPGLTQAQNLVAPLGQRNRRQTLQWMRLVPSSTKTVII